MGLDGRLPSRTCLFSPPMVHQFAPRLVVIYSSTFGGSPGTTTYTASYDPGSQTVTQAIVSNIKHDMFCEGLSLTFDGKIISTGGNTDAATSSFDSTSHAWTSLAVSVPLPLLRVKLYL